jgi:hypothetical protein
MLNLSGFVNINKPEQQESSEDAILKGFVNNDLEKAKAVIGEIRNWGGVDYKKIANGEWVKVVKDKEKKVAESGIHKVISSEITTKINEKNKIEDEFKQNWIKENNANLNKVLDRVKLARALSDDKNIKELTGKIYNEINDLRAELTDINKIIEVKKKEKRETAAGKKEISPEDEYFKNNFDSFKKILSETNKISEYKSANEVKPIVSVDDYWLCTNASFKTVYEYNVDDANNKETNTWVDPVYKKWNEMKNSGKYEFTQSPKSSSQYLIDRKTGNVYRMADHWGQCASCYWDVDFKMSYGIAVCNVKDFKRNGNSNWLNPEKESAIIANAKTIFPKLKEMVTNDKVYYDKVAIAIIKSTTSEIEWMLKRSTHLTEKEITNIKEQYKELFAI